MKTRFNACSFHYWQQINCRYCNGTDMYRIYGLTLVDSTHPQALTCQIDSEVLTAH